MSFCMCLPPLWLLILSLYSTPVISIVVNFEQDAPMTYWIDASCEQKGFPIGAARESFLMATRGARRLLNLNDQYQAWLYENLLFKKRRDFSLIDARPTQVWDVVGKQLPILLFDKYQDVLNHLQEMLGWIGAMTYELDRDSAEVLIYCDNDARWTLVPDDPVSIEEGETPNSERIFGEDAEYEDVVNVMRRDTSNRGCGAPGALGVTYCGYIPRNLYPEEEAPYLDNRRQTITICDLGLRSLVKKIGDISEAQWEFQEMFPLQLIPTFVLLHQLAVLMPYRSMLVSGINIATDDSWPGMLRTPAQIVSGLPAPFVWNSVLAYVADMGWGITQDLTAQQYLAGRNLFTFSEALKNVPFASGGPITLPTWLTLPGNVYQ